MSDDEDKEDSTSYKYMAQFHHILQRHDGITYHCYDRDRMNWELETIIEQPGALNSQCPNSVARSRNARLAGCTALHLAVMEKYLSVNLYEMCQRYQTIIEVLLKRGIDFTIKNHEGSTALHELVNEHYSDYRCRWWVRGKLDNAIVNLLLSAHVEHNVTVNPRDKSGVSHFHVACMANHSSAVESFLTKAGQPVDEVFDGDSTEFQGYTPLHFAVRFSALETVEILLKHGANVELRDARGMTPMELLLEQNMAIADVINTIDNHESGYQYRLPQSMADLEIKRKIMELLLLRTEKLEFDDTGLSRLHVACTLENTLLVEQYLAQIKDINQCIKSDSQFWPGYTALHFASHFDINTVRLLLDNGANIEAKDANGLTPFDICVERFKVEDLHYILQSNLAWRDILMSDNKTKLLDVVLAMRDSEMLDDFLKDSEKVTLRVLNDSPLWPGYSPLHLAVNFSETIKIITDHARDTYYGKEDFEKLEREYLKRIEVCLKRGIDVNIQDAHGRTAVHQVYRLQKPNVAELLLQDESRVENSVDADNLSHLYIACAFNRLDLVRKLLANDDSNVNLQIKPTFQWPQKQKYFTRGNRNQFFVTAESTPRQATETPDIVRILIKHGADAKTTPMESEKNSTEVGWYALYMDKPYIRPSLRSWKTYNDDDLSPFHSACLRSDLQAMEKFLESGVDVNLPVDFLSQNYPGCRPIHLVLHNYSNASNEDRIAAIDLLLKYGVDVDVRDVFDNTAFHAATKCRQPKEKLLHKILSIGTNIKLKNVFREEPLVTLLTPSYYSHSIQQEDIEFFLEHGCHVNVYDPTREEGLMAACFSKNYPMFKRIIRSPSITEVDDLGRNAIHNLACTQYSYRVDYTLAFRRLMERGCDIDHRDKLGRTPLQLALKFDNYKAVTRLLEAGADVNIPDARGHSAFADIEWESTFQTMAMHICRMQIAGLYVSELNVKILDELLTKWSLDETKIEKAKVNWKKMKDTKIKFSSVSPCDFFSEPGAVGAFPNMPVWEQQAINDFFRSMRTYHFKQLGYLLKLRYKKALRRLSLLESANVALNILLKYYPLPQICSWHIVQFLTNTDLQNVIAATK